jgi:hypothetical protein
MVLQQILPKVRDVNTVQVNSYLSANIKVTQRSMEENWPIHVQRAFNELAYQLSRDTAADIPLRLLVIVAPYLGIRD